MASKDDNDAIPKAPLNGFLSYMNERKKELGPEWLKKYPTPRDAKSDLTSQWKQLTPEERKEYISKVRKEKEARTGSTKGYKRTQTYKKLQLKLNARKTAGRFRKLSKLGKGTAKYTDETFGTDIPIFSEQFLEHNKEREGKVRKLRINITRLEEEEKALSLNLGRLKAAYSQYELEKRTQEKIMSDLDAQFQTYSKALQQAFSHLPIPGFPSGTTQSNIEEYMEKMHDLVLQPTNENQALLAKCRDVVKRIKL